MQCPISNEKKDPLSPAAGGAGSRAPGRQGQPRTFYLDFVFPGGWLDWYCWAGAEVTVRTKYHLHLHSCHVWIMRTHQQTCKQCLAPPCRKNLPIHTLDLFWYCLFTTVSLKCESKHRQSLLAYMPDVWPRMNHEDTIQQPSHAPHSHCYTVCHVSFKTPPCPSTFSI